MYLYYNKNADFAFVKVKSVFAVHAYILAISWIVLTIHGQRPEAGSEHINLLITEWQTKESIGLCDMYVIPGYTVIVVKIGLPTQ